MTWLAGPPIHRPATGVSTSPSARVRRHAHAPYKGALLELWRLCRSNDR